MSVPESRIPVIVGVGQVNDRPEVPHEGMDSLGLMVEALKRADADAGSGWLEGLSAILTVDQISFPKLGDCSPQVALAVGATDARCRQTPYPMGDGPIRLLNEAANMIAKGEATSVAITGGEALRTAGARKKLEAAGKTSDPLRASASVRKNAIPTFSCSRHQRMSTRSMRTPAAPNGARALKRRRLKAA